MNNENQILQNKKVIMKALSEIEEIGHKTYDNIKFRISETEEVLNPKDVNPECKCGHRNSHNYAFRGECNMFRCKCKKFVKSSKGVKNG